jgi:hypothetical protein
VPETHITETTIGFEDEHCTKGTTGMGVKRVHTSVEPKVSTSVTATNTDAEGKTVKSKLSATLAGVLVELESAAFMSCVGKTLLQNKETESGQMEAAGEGCGEFSEVTVVKPLNCTVSTPVKLSEGIKGKTVVKEPKAGVFEMYVEFLPPASGVFTEITFSGAKCAFKGLTFPIKGSLKAKVTSEEGCVILNGPALKFTTAETESTLKIGVSNARFEGTLTVRMAAEGGKETPVALTTF